MKKNNWHALESNAVLSLLNTSRNGISEEEAKKRLEQYGPNELKEEKKTTSLKILANQFKSILIIILVISAIVSAFISMRAGEPFIDTFVILVIVIINAILGFTQEYKAEQAVEDAQTAAIYLAESKKARADVLR